MNLEDLKKEIEQRTGIPAALLSGETPEENIEQANALLAYKKDTELQRPKHTREQFAAWINAQQGIETQDTAGAALADIEEAVRVAAGGYPKIKDGQAGVSNLPDARPEREQFAEWFNNKTAYNPFKDVNGWTKIL